MIKLQIKVTDSDIRDEYVELVKKIAKKDKIRYVASVHEMCLREFIKKYGDKYTD